MGRSRDQRQQFLNRANSDIAPCAGCGRGPLFVAQKSQFEILIVVMKPHPRPRIALLRREPSLPHTPHWPRFGGAFSSRRQVAIWRIS
jgi:hypothetical protein